MLKDYDCMSDDEFMMEDIPVDTLEADEPQFEYGREILKLAIWLTEKKIPYSLKYLFDGFQILGDGWDVICHWASMGHEDCLLESYGNIVDTEALGDSVEGWLTAEDVEDRITKYLL